MNRRFAFQEERSIHGPKIVTHECDSFRSSFRLCQQQPELPLQQCGVFQTVWNVCFQLSAGKPFWLGPWRFNQQRHNIHVRQFKRIFKELLPIIVGWWSKQMHEHDRAKVWLRFIWPDDECARLRAVVGDEINILNQALPAIEKLTANLRGNLGRSRGNGQLLTVFERVNMEFPVGNLRWTIAHLNDGSEATFRRMKALGVGWTMQDAMYNDGDQVVKEEGAEAARRMPPVMTAKKIGIVVSAGTDAHRVSTYNPFTVLQWLIDGKTASGRPLRGPEEAPSRADALRFYTSGSAWVAHDEDKRGSLEVGKFADLAVLSQDYLTEPVEDIGKNSSLLTMLGGKIVYAAGPYAQLESKPSAPKAVVSQK